MSLTVVAVAAATAPPGPRSAITRHAEPTVTAGWAQTPRLPGPVPFPPTTTTSPRATPAAPTTTARTATREPVPGGWRLVWADEFDGTRVNPAKWRAKNNTRLDFDLACITSDSANLMVGGGLLTLRALRKRGTCGTATRDYTTAYLTSQGRASFTYGRFEVRAKTPTGPRDSTGLWPAFWLRPDDGGNGEIDVVELPGGDRYYRAATQAILYGYRPTIKQDNRYPFRQGYPADGFHTYTTEWEPGSLRWFIDGVPVYQRDPSTTPWFDAAFNRPYHLRLNFQVGGWLGNPNSDTRFPADFQVDYVRVWQHR